MSLNQKIFMNKNKHCYKQKLLQLLKKLFPNKTEALRQSIAAAESLQSFPTLCDPIDGSPPGCPVPGILQTRTLEWVAISFSSA